ncbi:MAG: hypothetical protein EOP55_02020 [Sphingobacteriales bacterium]|nr:MAG: hypothetical protein EOP55_02020 [Sphingobacteriales bacterium]
MINNKVKAVYAVYEKRKNEKSISSNLMDPTPAGLRAECLKVYEEKKFPKEDPALRSFFGPLRGDENNYIETIRKFDIDKFKPVVNFLNGVTTKPNVKVVDLVDWLIATKKPEEPPIMPMLPGHENHHKEIAEANQPKEIESERIDLQQAEVSEPEKVDNVVDVETEKGSEIKNRQKKNIKKSAWFFIAAMTVFGGSYFGWYFGDKHCMYWNGNEYKPVACNTNIPGEAVVALNAVKVDRLKRITKQDTLTAYSIHKVFYSKINNKVEFYTDSGAHPTDSNRRLLPMSRHILNKYILRIRD